MNKILIAVFIFSSLVACQHSPQKKYFYLTAQTTEKNAPKASIENINMVIGIGPVDVAEYLQRTQIIDNQANNTLNVSDLDYWAEPLNKGIARVIALNLMQQENRSFVYFPWRSDSKPRYSLRVKIYSLTRNNNEASVIASWELVDNDNKLGTQHHNFRRTTPVEAGAKSLAQAYSTLFAELTNEMDVVLNGLNKVPQ